MDDVGMLKAVDITGLTLDSEAWLLLLLFFRTAQQSRAQHSTAHSSIGCRLACTPSKHNTAQPT